MTPEPHPYRSRLVDDMEYSGRGGAAGRFDEEWDDEDYEPIENVELRLEREREANIERMIANHANGCEAISGQPLRGETLVRERQLLRQAQALARKAAQKRFRGQ